MTPYYYVFSTLAPSSGKCPKLWAMVNISRLPLGSPPHSWGIQYDDKNGAKTEAKKVVN